MGSASWGATLSEVPSNSRTVVEGVEMMCNELMNSLPDELAARDVLVGWASGHAARKRLTLAEEMCDTVEALYRDASGRTGRAGTSTRAIARR